MPEVDVRLERARQALAIAESADSKIAAYRIAAEEIAAYMEETGATQEFLARNLGASPGTISKILRWRRQGYPEGTTPFTMADGSGPSPTQRAAQSHTRTTLADPAQRRQVLDSMPAETRAAVAREALADPVVRSEVVRSSPETARAIEQEAAEQHPSRTAHRPVAVPEPELGFYAHMAGPIQRLKAAADEVRGQWEARVESADPTQREMAQDELATIAASLSALVADWGGVTS